jgi:hypothetical protein
MSCELYRVSAACGLVLLLSSTAQAANKVGWALVDQIGTTSIYTADPKHSFNSTGGTATINPGQSGELTSIVFQNLYDGSPADVQVSADNSNGWCVADAWESEGSPNPADLAVPVQCFDAKGNKANIPFTVLYQSRNAPFGNAGSTNSFVYNKMGNYTVTLPGLTKLGGNVVVTSATSYRNPRCKPVTWSSGASSTAVTIQCYGSTGLGANPYFYLAYAVGEPVGVTPGVDPRSAWAYANDLTSTTAYEPNGHYQYNGFGTGRLTSQRTGPGKYTVTIPGTLTYGTSIAMVTATGTGSDYCNLAGWTASTINVACYKQGGAPADSRFEVSLESAN